MIQASLTPHIQLATSSAPNTVISQTKKKTGKKGASFFLSAKKQKRDLL